MASEVSNPHDHLFRSVFGEETEATGLLRAYLPEAVSRELLWSSIEVQAIAQLAMMAAYRASWPVLQRLVPLLAELGRVGKNEDLRRIVVYIATTREPERWDRFADAVRQQVPGGAELMNKTQEMLEIYGEVIKQEFRQEGLREGELRGKVLTIEGFLGRDVPWSTIEAATGIDEATFRRLKHQFEAVDDGTHPRLSHPQGLGATDRPGAQARDAGKPVRFACAAGQ